MGRISRTPAALAGLLLLATALSGAEPAADPYRFAPGDLLEVRVFGEEELSASFRVPPHGTITYPLLGDLFIRDRTSRQVEAEVVQRLKARDILKNPSVSVLVQEFAPRLVYVLGSVEESGAYEMPVEGGFHLSHAISMAGGFTLEADHSRIRIRRYANGGAETLTVDFSRFEDGTDDAMNILLEPGDQVLVRDLRSVYVIGEVNRPGEVRIPSSQEITVTEAISLAGGYKSSTADLTEVRVRRRGPAGVTSFVVDMKAVLNDREGAQDPVVRPGDAIHVPTRGLF